MSEAVESGTELELLRALRWRCWVAFMDPATPSGALVSLSRVVREILEQEDLLAGDAGSARA